LIVSGCDGAVNLEMAEDALDAVSLAVEAFAVANRLGAVGFRRDDGLDPTSLQVIAYGIGVVGLVGKKSGRLLLGQIDQRVVALAVRRLTGREMKGDRAASGITETMNFTGEPAPRAAKSSLMNPPFPPAAETWARTEVLSML
jgi:hypothetical protein